MIYKYVLPISNWCFHSSGRVHNKVVKFDGPIYLKKNLFYASDYWCYV